MIKQTNMSSLKLEELSKASYNIFLLTSFWNSTKFFNTKILLKQESLLHFNLAPPTSHYVLDLFLLAEIRYHIATILFLAR